MIFISEWSSKQVLGILTLLLINLISISSSCMKVHFCSNPSLPLPLLLLVLFSLSQKPLCPCIFSPSYLLTCIQRHNLAVVLRVQDQRKRDTHIHTHIITPFLFHSRDWVSLPNSIDSGKSSLTLPLPSLPVWVRHALVCAAPIDELTKKHKIFLYMCFFH